MSVYGKPKTAAVRCTWCRKYGLPCGDRVHKDAIERYVSVAETTHLTINVDQLAAARLARRLEPRDVNSPRAAARRARRLSDVAVLVMVLSAAAAVLAIGAVFL